jgi:NADH-quinone oxidoreductase subunit F
VTITDAPRIVTGRIGQERSWTLESYVSTEGYRGLRKALTMTPEEVHEHVNTANLLGRGGAGFEAGRKWGMLAKSEPVYLVINGDESEPATFKDHMLIEEDPHQLIEGALICAYAVRADQIFLFIRGEFALGLERVAAALNEAYRYGAVGKDIFGSGWSIDVVVHPGAGAYICGEETALLESLEGKRGFPRIKPPFFPAAIGLYGAPTIVNNVETVANLPWVVINGGEAFAALGTGRSKGTKLLALSGDVVRPGNYELEFAKVTFRDLLFDPALGGGIRDGNELKCIIPGGVSAPWFGTDMLDVTLANEDIAGHGSMAGSGAVTPMDHTRCMVRAAWRISRFFHRESCGQCTPCREGSGWVEKIMERIEQGSGRESDLDLLMDVCDGIAPGVSWPPAQTTICVLGPSIPSSVAWGIRLFRDEFLAHVREGRCPFPPDRIRIVGRVSV